VWGKEALSLKVKADEGKLSAGVPYHVYVGVTNKSNVPLYNVGLSIDETPHEHFIFQPDQQFSETLGELKPGETFFVKHPYILIPDGESESVFNPALSSATFVGEEEHPGEGIEKVKPPTVYSLEAPADTPGYVHLRWQAVPGAEGYEVFATKNLDTPFSSLPVSVLTSPSSSEAITELPATATEAYVPASSSEALRYALSTLVGSHLSLESSPVIEAAATAAEFGRCIKVPAKTGRYSSAACTASTSKDSYEWYPAFGGSKPLEKTHFTTSATGSVKLETKAKQLITCTGESGSGAWCDAHVRQLPQRRQRKLHERWRVRRSDRQRHARRRTRDRRNQQTRSRQEQDRARAEVRQRRNRRQLPVRRQRRHA
jgi:hypothetical protein